VFLFIYHSVVNVAIVSTVHVMVADNRQFVFLTELLLLPLCFWEVIKGRISPLSQLNVDWNLPLLLLLSSY